MSVADQKPIGSGFAAKSEPHEILADMDFSGKVAIITGGYSGIGLETVRALAGKGAKVIVPVRDEAKAAANLSGVEGDVHAATMDLSDIGSVGAFADQITSELNHLDLLINNAGVMACPMSRVGPGWESQFGINHMGHFALAKGVMPLLEKADAPRVVALSSIAHQRGGIDWDDIQFENREYHKWESYAQAKSANALFANALNRRMNTFDGRAFSVHPGGIFTPLQRHLPVEEQVELGWLNPDGTPTELAKHGFKSTTQGCTTTLWAATSPMLNDKPGVYCEDCDIAAALSENSPPFSGAAPHICDDDAAERLWDVSEALLAAA